MNRRVPFYLGGIGSILAIVCSILVVTPFFQFLDFKSYKAALFLTSFFFSLLGIIGTFLSYKEKQIIAGFMMILSALGGIISISIYYLLPAVFLISGGFLNVVMKENNAEAKPNT
ncbi:hypothetical protein [Bacillus taeanensis]|uniref:DUF4064 domain-containing protein n=1 Tax=Bacillus taeanensis TaxID=273032 RepID=A0A366Y0L2_9BACI|nr:hypothetical protein [Bacillus taeanensis]RBW71386.1 hypothetical protein DS031_01155 [Bacillus taeanensis]